MKVDLIVFINILILSTVHCQQCIKSAKNMQNLNITRFATGRWYVYKSSLLYGQLKVSCTYGDFKNSTFGKFNVNYIVLNKKRSDVIPYNKNQLGFDADISVPFPILNLNITMTAKSVIVGTDYDNYGIIYGCGNLGFVTVSELLIISRSNYTLDANSTAIVNSTLISSGLNKIALKTSPVSNCKN
ncbi:unnamed protein product [Chironomus riparius]|uniref:Lipocalin n=1 Tax=Chironomus riparius TaxID=315576 RepID=A0A9N9RIQ1_9DIPT|nr:unnamed protein product [Chironomus riparius]